MRFSETVDLEDVQEANRLIKSALRESAVSCGVSIAQHDTDNRLTRSPAKSIST
jgi:DNA replicative helicase MCM subunit Mcm2 (Cdc46/Mcm family)